MKKKLLTLSLSSFITSAVLFVINYFFFHYTGDDRANGIAFMFTAYHDECEKPFVTDLIGQLAVSMLVVAIVTLMIVIIFCGVKKKKKEAVADGAEEANVVEEKADEEKVEQIEK